MELSFEDHRLSFWAGTLFLSILEYIYARTQQIACLLFEWHLVCWILWTVSHSVLDEEKAIMVIIE